MPEQRQPILEALEVTKRFSPRGGRLRVRGERVLAVDRVSLKLWDGEAVGLVGRSGSGKSTLARLLVGLEQPDAGEVRFAGRALKSLPARELADVRRQVQLVLQDPLGALDPMQAIGSAVKEPLVAHRLATRGSRPARVGELLARVGLPSSGELLSRRPHRLSGGERQRAALARALACAPRALILDEPVSALDPAVRGRLLNVLLDLKAGMGLAILLVAHDLPLVAQLCERVIVLDRGAVVEQGPVADVLARPTHEATRALLAASAGGGQHVSRRE